jgi:outer membrane protein
MNKIIVLLALSASLIACNKKETNPTKNENNKSESTNNSKTAYVDTSVLMKDYQEAKDIETKYKAKAETMGKKLDGELTRFKADAANFQKNAQANGQAWAQQKGQELQQREQQLQGAQQQMMQQLQEQSGTEMDTVVKQVKKFIKVYGKQNGYQYIYGTGIPSTILYAEDKYDITKEILELLNEKYKAKTKK